MITLEKMQKSGISFVSNNNKIQFSVSIQTMFNVKNSNLDIVFNKLLNSKLILNNYTTAINQIFITFLIYPNDNKGVDWKERKYYKRSEKHLFIDIKVNEYEDFCNAEPLLAKELLKTHLLRAVKKFLQTQKDFNFPLFLKDLEEVL